jgi:hypothetical protein
MKSKHIIVSIVTALLAFPVLETLAETESITIDVLTTFDYPGTGNQTLPQKINDTGGIAGVYLDSSLVSRGFFRLPNGNFSAPIVEPNDTSNLTEVRGLNNSPLICGDYLGSDGAFHGFFLSNGSHFREFDIAGALSSQVLGVNNVADFVGGFTGSSGVVRAFVSLGGTITSFSVARFPSTLAYQLNSSNQLVGYYTDKSGITHGYLRDGTGTLHFPIDPSGSTGTILFGLNDSNDVVGRYADSGGLTHALLFRPPDRFLTFDFPGSTFTSFNGINNNGFICGRYLDASGVAHGIIARIRRGASAAHAEGVEMKGHDQPSLVSPVNRPSPVSPVNPRLPSALRSAMPAS